MAGLSMQPTLFDAPPRRHQAETSLDAWAHVSRDLNHRQVVVFRALWAYLAMSLQRDVTGGELTDYMVRHGLARDVNGVRPRLSELRDKGWVVQHPARPSRVVERSSGPYAPVLPVSALDRVSVHRSE